MIERTILIYQESGLDSVMNHGALVAAFKGTSLIVDTVKDLDMLALRRPESYSAVLIAGNSAAFNKEDLPFALEYVHEERGKGHDRNVFVAGPQNGIETPHATERYLAHTCVLNSTQAGDLIKRVFGESYQK